jgi:hypothetical protein
VSTRDQCLVFFNILLSQGDEWRKLRTVSNPIVARPATVSLFLPQYNLVIDSVVELVNCRMAGKSSVTVEAFEKTLQLAALECKQAD